VGGACVQVVLDVLEKEERELQFRLVRGHLDGLQGKWLIQVQEITPTYPTTLPKVDTICTAPPLIPTVNGNTVRSFSTHGHQSAAKGSSRPRSHALTSDSCNFLTSRLFGLVVRRWRLIGYFPILY
jgi:hypothetical protein